MRATTSEQILAAFGRLQGLLLSEAIDPESFIVEAVNTNYGLAYVGCSSTGELALIVPTSKSAIPCPPLRLDLLVADYGIYSRLVLSSDVSSARVSVVRCLSADDGLVRVFAAVCSHFLEDARQHVLDSDVADFVSLWTSLFWQLAQRVSVDVVGLVGELSVIAKSEDVECWIEAWHADPQALFDFRFFNPPTVVEVKATTAGNRNHLLSLLQAHKAIEEGGFFASVLVTFDQSETTVGEMVEEIIARCSKASSRLKVWDVISKTCGAGTAGLLARRFEKKQAVESVLMFPADGVPVPDVSLPLPVGVSGLVFHSQFDGA